MMHRQFYWIFGIVYLVVTLSDVNAQKQESTINLKGEWNFQIDSADVGTDEKWFLKDLTDNIKFPGSMAENDKGYEVTLMTKWTGSIVDKSWYNDDKFIKYRQTGNIKLPFWLTPNKYYVGAAWYQKEINIPDLWKEKHIVLFLERCHWETKIWFDGKEVGKQNSLGTAHEYDLTEYVSPGKHKITICVDNRIKDVDVGENAHSISDHTQTNWNGIVGDISLRSSSPLFIKQVNIFPNIKTGTIKVHTTIKNITGKDQFGKIYFQVKPLNFISKLNVNSKSTDYSVEGDEKEIIFEYEIGKNALLWDEFDPNLYQLKIDLKSKSNELIDSKIEKFGMREINSKDNKIMLNGRPIFIRGTLECSIFPKTGYPPTNIEEWERIYKICKSYGLNSLRFHSWCPPEAAFEAADQMGFYLQVECSAWAEIGEGKPIDQFIYDESERMVKVYGNHPSFCMLAYGNEPSGKNQSIFLSKFVSYWKNKDSRRLYTSAAGWPLIKENDFFSTPEPRIQGWGMGLKSVINKEAPQTVFDFKNITLKYDKPIISHEIGQWCAFPNIKEIDKYTGVLKARNFEIVKETLESNKMIDQADDFLSASGKLQVLCYKADIEAALRTPGLSGFQLLDLHDFPGQGTALVGVLDAFWEEKGYVTGKEYSRFCNSTVPLARLQKMIFKNNETFVAQIEVAHFGKSELKKLSPEWRIRNNKQGIIFSGKLKTVNIPIGNNFSLGNIECPLNSIQTAQKLNLEVKVGEFANDWDFWVYPEKIPGMFVDNIVTLKEYSSLVDQALDDGKNVLLLLNPKTINTDVSLGFSSIFWNTAWTGKQPPHTLGILCNPEHPLFEYFPTEYHTNWQWWDIISKSKAMVFDSLSGILRPLVQVIDDWNTNRKLGLIFEAKAGKGKIIVCSIDLMNELGKRPVARQLLYSLLKYMSSEKFKPTNEIKIEKLKGLIKLPDLMDKARVIKTDAYVENYESENVIDNDVTTFWHTPWEGEIPPYPHFIEIDLGSDLEFIGYKCTPRQDGIAGGWISKAEFYISTNGIDWGTPISTNDFSKDAKEKIILFGKTTTARYIRFVAVKGFDNQEFASLSELKLIPKQNNK